MKTTINFYEFSRWFEQHRPDNFSRAGLQALFDYFENFEEDTGESIEFDPIAICVEYTEYDDLKEFHQNYGKEDYPTIESISDYTQVIPFGTESFVILDF